MSSSRRELIPQIGHGQEIVALALSSNGRTAATEGRDFTIRIWDTKRGLELRDIGSDTRFANLAFSRNNDQLIAFGSEVAVWNLVTGQKLGAWTIPSEESFVSFNADAGSITTVTDDGLLKTWGVATGKVIRSVQAMSSGEFKFRFYMQNGADQLVFQGATPDARWLVFGRHPFLSAPEKYPKIVVLDQTTGRRLQLEARCPCLFSPDGSRLLTDGGQWLELVGEDGVVGRPALKVWEVGSWRPLSVIPLPVYPPYVTFSADARVLAIGGLEGPVTVWDVENGAELDSFKEDGVHLGIAMSPDGSHVAVPLQSRGVRTWDRSANGERCDLTSHVDALTAIAVAPLPNGHWIATGHDDGSVRMWDTATGVQRFTLLAHTEAVEKVIFGSDGRSFVTANRLPSENDTPSYMGSEGSLVRHLRQGELSDNDLQQLRKDSEEWLKRFVRTRDPGSNSTCLAPPSVQLPRSEHRNTFPRAGFVAPPLMVLPSSDSFEDANIAKRWDTLTGSALSVFSGATSRAALDPQNRFFVAATKDSHVKVWDVAGRELLTPLPKDLEAGELAISPDGQWLATVGEGVNLWKTDGWHLERTLPSGFDDDPEVAFGSLGESRGDWLALSDDDKKNDRLFVRVKEVSTGKDFGVLPGAMPPLATSSSGRLLATVDSGDADATIWDIGSRQPVAKIVGQSGEIAGFAFGPGDDWLAAASNDGTSGIWDSRTGDLLAKFVSLRGTNDWFVATPDGLFDGSTTAWKQILWRFGGNTFDVASGEAFFNEFFHPGLLADVVSGMRPKAPIDIAQKDRRQLNIRLTVDDHQDPVTTRTTTVKLEITEAAPDKDHRKGSGAQDARLFRNGSLVKMWHEDVLKGKTSVSLETSVQLTAGENRFTAYAFNSDNIKSSDSVLTITGADSLKRRGTAYILAIGVDRYKNDGFDLSYAVADARLFASEVKAQQEKLGNFERVEVIPLLDAQASRANIMAALSRLAGNQPSLPPDVPFQIAKLEPAQPEDVIFIYFAGHGIADGARFFLVPQDLGYAGAREAIDAVSLRAVEEHSISDKDLDTVFEEIDAGNIVLVIDACNSGQALEAEEKRRGPMNSKGLAQLAYEKGMFILTAAQGYQQAKEVSQLGHGLLTYALVKEGLEEGKASPGADTISVRDWLDYAVQEVPQLQSNWLTHTRGFEDASGKPLTATDPTLVGLQTPRVFYRREPEPTPLIVARHANN